MVYRSSASPTRLSGRPAYGGASSLKVNYPIALGTREIKDRFSSDETLPLTVVINRDGKVTEIISGILLRQEFEEKIKPLLTKDTEGEIRNAESNY